MAPFSKPGVCGFCSDWPSSILQLAWKSKDAGSQSHPPIPMLQQFTGQKEAFVILRLVIGAHLTMISRWGLEIYMVGTLSP